MFQGTLDKSLADVVKHLHSEAPPTIQLVELTSKGLPVHEPPLTNADSGLRTLNTHFMVTTFHP